MILNELAIGDQFTVDEVLYEKITPIKKSCCTSYTAKNVSTGENVILKPKTVVVPVIKEQ